MELPGAPQPLFGDGAAVAESEKRLHLFNVHTDEEVDVAFFQGAYLDSGVKELNHFLRDWRVEAVRVMDPQLFDLLYALQTEVGPDRPVCILSAFRTERTNAMLAKVNPHVARHSLHIAGQAADIFVPGCELEALRDTALALQAGGVGFYPGSGFIHVDTGRVRTWSV